MSVSWLIDIEACLDSAQAAEAASAVGQMSAPDLGLESVNEVQQQLSGRDGEGACGV